MSQNWFSASFFTPTTPATARCGWNGRRAGWGYTNNAAWSDPTALGTTIPNSLKTGYTVGDNFDTAKATLNQYDPSRIFSSPLLDALLP
jgi:hypothetical protein